MNYTLDTSAVLSYFLDEPGADEVKEILLLAKKGEREVFVSFMTFMELLYRIWKLFGEHQAKKIYLLLRGLPVHEINQSEGLLTALIFKEWDASLDFRPSGTGLPIAGALKKGQHGGSAPSTRQPWNLPGSQ